MPPAAGGSMHLRTAALKFLLCVAELGIPASGLTVSQPAVVKAEAGTNATLECSYSFSGNESSGVGQFMWYKNSTTLAKVSNESAEYQGRISSTDAQTFTQNRKADITIHHVHINDSGLYLCEVELLRSGKALGNGTELLVEKVVDEKGTAKPGLKPIIVTTLGVTLGTFLVLAVSILLCIARMKTGGSRARAQDAPLPHLETEMEDLTSHVEYVSLGPLERQKSKCSRDESQEVLYADIHLD
ncbi:natural cytotoxicity triggering receptor 3-like [Lissotriton helveticus]